MDNLLYTDYYASPLGQISMTADETGITSLHFVGQEPTAPPADKKRQSPGSPVFADVKQWLHIYFSGKEPDFLPPVHLSGTAFQLAVWNLLRAIPYGATTTYGALAGQLADQLGKPHMSAQAVGQAVKQNPVAILIPCHRVIGADGSLIGYAGGLDRKAALLALESA